MWGDEQHIKRLKEEQSPWPSDFPDTKKTKKQERQQAKTDRAAQKAAGAEARKLAKWTQTTPKPTKQPPAKRPNAADLANLKAAEWQAKQEAHDAKAHQRALKATVRAEKRAQQAQARATAVEQQWLKDEQARWKEERRGRTATASYIDYASAYTPSGCSIPLTLLLILLLLAILAYLAQ